MFCQGSGDKSFDGGFTCKDPSCTRKRTFQHEADLRQHMKNPGRWHGKNGKY